MTNDLSTAMENASSSLVIQPSSIIQQLSDCIHHHLLSEADHLISQENLENSSEEQIQLLIGHLRLKQRRWDDAEAVFNKKISDSSEVSGLYVQLTRNLAIVEKYHPELLPILLDNSPCTQCRLTQTPSGELTIEQRPISSQWVSLTNNNSAEAACRNHLQALDDRSTKESSIALCGIGDGYILMHLASHPPDLHFDLEKVIFIFEPHPEVLFHVLMIHDMTGENSPFRQKRIFWCVGADWAEQAELLLRKNVYVPYPQHFLALSIVRNMMETRVNQLVATLVKWEADLHQSVKNRYQERSHADWLNPFKDEPTRPSRAMLITSRFSTVLQYSTRDIAQGLQENKWESSIVCENEPYEIITNRAILKVMHEFVPDVVIQIDHLRYERPHFYPDDLPFICWIQDDLPNLTSRKAGDSIGPRDFVLTGAKPVYVNKYGYPERQIIHLEKLTRRSSQQHHGCGEGPPDLVFVSNASQVPSEVIRQLAEEFSAVEGLGEIIKASGLKMMAVYESGDSIISVRKIRSIIEEETKSQGGQWKSEESLDKLAIRLSGILNNALYRQQALDWVVEAAEKMDLSLELYGNGWEDNPKYARFAKGYIQYGEPLEELTRRAKINLQIIPYSCLHQRLLDGLTAGGFFLIRSLPLDILGRKIGDYVRKAVQCGAESVEEAFEKFDSQTASRFRRCLNERATIIELYGSDCIKRYRTMSEEDQNLFYKYPPHYDEVLFHDALSLRDRIEHYLAHPECRSRTQTDMRNWVNQHYTYRSAWKRIMHQIGQLVESESTAAQETTV